MIDDHNNNNNNNIYNNNSTSIDSNRDSLNNNFSSINSISNNTNSNSIDSDTRDFLKNSFGSTSSVNNNNLNSNSIISGNIDNIVSNLTIPRTNQLMTIATHNVRGFNDPVKRELFFNYVKTNKIDIASIAETNCNGNKEKWYLDDKDKYRTHWSSDGKGSRVALIISKHLNKYICKVKKFKGRAICAELALPKKTTISI